MSDGLWLGVELRLEAGPVASDPWRLAVDANAPWLYAKQDGSLQNSMGSRKPSLCAGIPSQYLAGYSGIGAEPWSLRCPNVRATRPYEPGCVKLEPTGGFLWCNRERTAEDGKKTYSYAECPDAENIGDQPVRGRQRKPEWTVEIRIRLYGMAGTADGRAGTLQGGRTVHRS